MWLSRTLPNPPLRILTVRDYRRTLIPYSIFFRFNVTYRSQKDAYVFVVIGSGTISLLFAPQYRFQNVISRPFEVWSMD